MWPLLELVNLDHFQVIWPFMKWGVEYDNRGTWPTNHLMYLLKNKCIFIVWPIKTHHRIRPSDPHGYLKFTIYFMMGDLAVQLDYTGLDIKSTFTIWLITTTLQHISYLLSLDTWWAFSLYNQWSPILPHHLLVLTLRSRNLKNLVSTPTLLTSTIWFPE